ncbi:hypothetical protein E2C01_017036 [Portunus trituberculatus]|uniref:Uncharacterized protein n=1 Tax=Portunus trituberculatus TaxID=210409 RepID=A0A5B7DS30_PORTR|nr:hypothetical protein [Portunus trituberculatus]
MYYHKQLKEKSCVNVASVVRERVKPDTTPRWLRGLGRGNKKENCLHLTQDSDLGLLSRASKMIIQQQQQQRVTVLVGQWVGHFRVPRQGAAAITWPREG